MIGYRSEILADGTRWRLRRVVYLGKTYTVNEFRKPGGLRQREGTDVSVTVNGESRRVVWAV